MGKYFDLSAFVSRKLPIGYDGAWMVIDCGEHEVFRELTEEEEAEDMETESEWVDDDDPDVKELKVRYPESFYGVEIGFEPQWIVYGKGLCELAQRWGIEDEFDEGRLKIANNWSD